MINVLVIDDSSLMRKVISDILNSDPEINVLDTAINGTDALREWVETNGNYDALVEIEGEGHKEFVEMRKEILLY